MRMRFRDLDQGDEFVSLGSGKLYLKLFVKIGHCVALLGTCTYVFASENPVNRVGHERKLRTRRENHQQLGPSTVRACV